MNTTEKILIIENDIAWRDQFEKILRTIGETREIQKVDFTEFMNLFKQADHFDGIGYCFVDLELGPGSDSRINDRWGHEKVLPHVRRLAPWVSVACISRYITGQAEIVGELSTSDFDGIYPKQIISEGNRTHPEFNKKCWMDILLNLKIKRNASLTGRSVTELNELFREAHKAKLNFDDAARESVEETGEEEFRQAISLLGLNGTHISLDEIVTGFSGIYVGKLGVYGESEKGPNHSYWLLKWGSPIRKIAHEVDAHRRLLRKGLERRLQVPLLHNNVINWGGFGLIAYGFEEDAKTALETISESGIPAFAPILRRTVKHLYGRGRRVLPISPRDTLHSWWKLDVDEQKSIPSELMCHTLEVTHAMIHGDFHLRNILIKEDQATLIDFAKSDYQPIAIDAAKIIIDALVFAISEIPEDAFEWFTLKASPIQELVEIFEEFLTGRDDKSFLQIALRAYAAKYLDYPDVADGRKDQLRRTLGKGVSD